LWKEVSVDIGYAYTKKQATTTLINHSEDKSKVAMPRMTLEVCQLKIKVVLFDLGSTLATPWMLEESFHKILESLEISLPFDEIENAFEEAEKDLEKLRPSELSEKPTTEQHWHLWLSLVLKHLGFPIDKELLREIEKRWYDYIDSKAYPDVTETVLMLREKGLKTGIVSAAYEKDISAILERAGLEKNMFDVIVGADTTERAKPHPEAFRCALRKLEAKPKEALFIGDSIKADYEPAEEIGIKSILIRRRRDAREKGRRLRTINSLRELFRYID
jgi:putative hydrolase of the HAD superfamily